MGSIGNGTFRGAESPLNDSELSLRVLTMTVLPPSPPLPSPDVVVLDDKALAALRDLDPNGQAGLLQRIMSTYDTSLVRMLGQVREGVARGDWTAVGNVAHTLKSSSTSVGALELARRSIEIEKMVRAGRGAEIGALIAPWLDEMQRVRVAVRALMGPAA